MRSITIHLLKPGKGQQISYTGELIAEAPGYRQIRAHWSRPPLDLGYVVFEPGDRFDEHFYAERWFNIFAIHGAGGQFKGWYCNVTRPAVLTPNTITSEDLELDLFVPPNRNNPLRLDLEEFAARGFDQHEPATHHAALAALAELEQMAHDGTPPFDRVG